MSHLNTRDQKQQEKNECTSRKRSLSSFTLSITASMSCLGDRSQAGLYSPPTATASKERKRRHCLQSQLSYLLFETTTATPTTVVTTTYKPNCAVLFAIVVCFSTHFIAFHLKIRCPPWPGAKKYINKHTHIRTLPLYTQRVYVHTYMQTLGFARTYSGAPRFSIATGECTGKSQHAKHTSFIHPHILSHSIFRTPCIGIRSSARRFNSVPASLLASSASLLACLLACPPACLLLCVRLSAAYYLFSTITRCFFVCARVSLSLSLSLSACPSIRPPAFLLWHRLPNGPGFALEQSGAAATRLTSQCLFEAIYCHCRLHP